MQNQQTTDLAALIASHSAMMTAYEAAYELDDADETADAQAPLYPKLLETRKAILACRPGPWKEVAMKASLMASDRAFNFWDIDGHDVEGLIPEVIASLIPVGLEAEGHRHAA